MEGSYCKFKKPRILDTVTEASMLTIVLVAFSLLRGSNAMMGHFVDRLGNDLWCTKEVFMGGNLLLHGKLEALAAGDYWRIRVYYTISRLPYDIMAQ